jgi:acetoin utilization protein AcuB
MLVAEWMTRDPLTATPDESVGVVASLMIRRNVRRVPIVQRDGHLVGIVTKSDVLGACPASFNPFSAGAEVTRVLIRPAQEIMSHPPFTVAPDAPLESAARMMIDRKVGGLPVLSSTGLVGILTESDLFRAFTVALGADEPGSVRITFDVTEGEDAISFAVDLARRHGLRVVSAATFVRGERRAALLRLAGDETPAFIEELCKTGHRVLSVLRG